MTLHLYWIQVKDLTLASLKSRYRKTWAGFLWVVMNPILMFGVQSLVFKKFLNIQIPDYYLFLLGGLLPWIFISSTIQMGTPVFVTQSHLLRSFKINPLVILASGVLDNFFNFMASFILILGPFYFWADKEFLPLLLIPLSLIPLLMGTFAMTLIFSTLNVFYRDINFVMSFVFSLLFFITPIFYPRHFVPLEFQWMIDCNPLYYFIEPFRIITHEAELVGFGMAFMKSLGLGFILSGLSVGVWKRKLNAFYHKL